MSSEFPAIGSTTITAYPSLPALSVMPNQVTSEAKTKNCHQLLLPRRTLAVHHGHYDPHQVGTLDVMGFKTPGRGICDGAAQHMFAMGAAQCSICIILPQACSKMDHTFAPIGGTQKQWMAGWWFQPL